MSQRLLQSCLEQALAQTPKESKIAVALSGGPDSSALAICAARWAKQMDRSIWLFHVHHGLHARADDWTAMVQRLAQLLNCELAIRHVRVDLAGGHGVEGAARNARYAAIADMAAMHGVDTILLAHHQQDQAETVLMRLLRGSGVSGMAAMTPVAQRSGLRWVRPWLDVPREALIDEVAQFSERTGWQPVDDPSNADGNLARGTLRSKVIPAIETHWPAWQQTLARHAQQAAHADRLLLRYGEQLLAHVSLTSQGAGPLILLARWRELSADEQILVMRVWFKSAGVQMPTERRLNELLRQLRQVHALGHDRDLRWEQRDCSVRCIRGQLHLDVKIMGSEGENASEMPLP